MADKLNKFSMIFLLVINAEPQNIILKYSSTYTLPLKMLIKKKKQLFCKIFVSDFYHRIRSFDLVWNWLNVYVFQNLVQIVHQSIYIIIWNKKKKKM